MLLDSDFDLTQLVGDTCLFIESKSDGSIILPCLYADDIYIATKALVQKCNSVMLFTLQKREIVAKLQLIFRLKL